MTILLAYLLLPLRVLDHEWGQFVIEEHPRHTGFTGGRGHCLLVLGHTELVREHRLPILLLQQRGHDLYIVLEHDGSWNERFGMEF